MLLCHYLEESYHPTSYAVNVYVVPGPQALRLTRLSRQDLENNKGPRVQCFFRKASRSNKDTSSKRASKKALDRGAESNNQNLNKSSDEKASGSQKRKRKPIPEVVKSEDMDDFIVDEKDNLDYDVEDFTDDIRRIESESEDDTWSFSVSAAAPPRKKPRKIGGKSKSAPEKLPKTSRDKGEIITLSSD